MVAAACCVAGVTVARASGSWRAGASGGGGSIAPGTPTVRDVVCMTDCVGLREPTVGGLVQVSGLNLGRVTKMTFPSRTGRLVAAVTQRNGRTAVARVPAGAIDGRVRVRDDYGNSSNLSRPELDIRPRSELGSAGALEVAEAETTPRTAFFFGLHYPRLDFVIRSSQRLNDLRIDVVDSSGGIVKSFFRNDVAANTTQEVRWNGKGFDGRPARNGSYAFRIRSQSGRVARRSAGVKAATGFKLYGYIFPLRGRHTYGDGIGAPRAGHTHQGQDVLSACGPKLVAARGGRVQYAGYQGAAGNYIVIDGKDTGVDFVYMHMMRPATFKVGDVVRTGQQIGNVGETGDATACHLHFEMWSAPGWYEGGHFLDPTPSLKRWDRYS
ncbi:MAG: M23 family metallopeptidase [Solirubrobacterales bacterium]